MKSSKTTSTAVTLPTIGLGKNGTAGGSGGGTGKGTGGSGGTNITGGITGSGTGSGTVGVISTTGGVVSLGISGACVSTLLTFNLSPLLCDCLVPDTDCVITVSYTHLTLPTTGVV